MAETPERRIKKLVSKTLTALGAYYFYPVTSGYGTSGVPDIVGCYRGRFFGIECKANGNKPTVLQQINLDKIAAAGGIALIIDEKNVASLKEIMEEQDEQPQA